MKRLLWAIQVKIERYIFDKTENHIYYNDKLIEILGHISERIETRLTSL